MEFELEPKPKSTSKEKAFRTETLNGKKYYVNSKVKARHMVQVEQLYGTKIGEVEKGLRILSTLMYEAMGMEALTYDQLLDYDLDELEPILSLVGG